MQIISSRLYVRQELVHSQELVFFTRWRKKLLHQ